MCPSASIKTYIRPVLFRPATRVRSERAYILHTYYTYIHTYTHTCIRITEYPQCAVVCAVQRGARRISLALARCQRKKRRRRAASRRNVYMYVCIHTHTHTPTRTVKRWLQQIFSSLSLSPRCTHAAIFVS